MAGAARNGPVPAPAKPPANTPAAERVVATTKPSHTPAKPTPIASPASWDGYFINLARDEKRRRHMEGQFAELGIQGRYQRFEAVDGSRLERSSPLTPGEVGVYRSHLDVLEQAASDGRPVHILEDDTGLCDLTAPAIDAAAQNGAIDDFDILFLDFMPPETMSAIRVLHALYQEVTKNGSTVIDNPDQLKIIDIQNLYQWNTTSYVVGPRNIGRVLAVLREEWRRGPGLAVDMAIQAAARTKQLRLGSFFPFVTTVSLEQNQDSSKGRTDALDAVIARNIFRHSFFVRRNIKGFAAPALARLIERHRQPDPEGAIDLYVDLQRYQLTKPRQ
jgi:GR25 family glycosyltransferase involved in LPS biosynthesis